MTPPLPTTLAAFFWHFIRKQPVAFTVFFLAPMTLVLETTVLPYALKIIVDTMTNYQGDRSGIFHVLAPALWLYGLSWGIMEIVLRAQNWWQAFVLPRFCADIRLSVTDYLAGHAYHYFSNQLTGSLANKVSDLPRALDSIRMILCWNVIASTAVTLAAIILMATVSPLFSLILTVWAMLHVAITCYFARQINDAAKQNAEDKSALSGAIVDTITNMVSVRIFARKRHEMKVIQAAQMTENASLKRLIFVFCYLRFIMDVLMMAMMGAMLYGLIRGWQQHHISTGDVAFVVYGTSCVMYHMWSLGEALTNLFREIGIARQALSLITVPHELKDAADAVPLVVTEGRITFDHVTFHYIRNRNIFSGKNVIISPAEKVGLVGFSGSGKTTFVNLIMRFFDVESGCILIDGQDIRRVTQDSLHENISMIPQDTSLFHRSLLENIRYGKLSASDEEVMEAAKKAHCHEFIEALPEGYQALVGERGVKLSGGQRQRIAIARAILKDAPILILDEATSALDSVTEKHIQHSLHSLMQDRTTIIIAHRLSTLSAVDRILVFDKGTIIEDGSHKELLAQQGHYARMWHMQAGGFLPDGEDSP